MEIGIIQTGRVGAALAATHGDYPSMIAAMLPGGDFRFRSHAVVDGAPLPPPASADGWLITGSRHGVYDDLPWIAPLKTWLRTVRGAGRPILGICFGHQILAEAFGGRAIRHSGGWRLGVHDFLVTPQPGWLTEATPVRLHSVHQDQVVAIPDDATVWATSPGCALAGLAYGDPARPDAVSIQPHPEFSASYVGALARTLTDDGRVPRAVGEGAIAEIGAVTVDNLRVARWLARYLRGRP